MRRPDRARVTLALLALLAAGAALAAAPAEPAYRYRAPIDVQRPGAFVQLPLPASAYAHGLQAGLADLRIVDARGERVPYAFLPPPPQAAPTPPPRDALLYALPRQRAASGDWALPVTVQVRGAEIRVQQQQRTSSTLADAVPPGWLFDLGTPRAGAATTTSTHSRALLLAWSGPADFSAAYDLQTSTDLRHWAPAESGQLMALTSPAGPLTQPKVPLPADAARFVRLLWHEPATAPRLTTARLLAEPLAGPAQEVPTWLEFAPTAAPKDVPKDAPPPSPHQALYFDLGGPLPVTQIDLTLGPGNRVLPLQIEGRAAPGQPWQPLAQGVIYRLEREGQVNLSPPLALTAALRYLRLLPDERAAAPPRDALRLRVQARLPQLVFAAQGQPPFTLLAGSPQAKAGALPVAALVPALQDERPRFGQATLGAWSEDAAVAHEIDADQQRAAWRPWLLWAVLLAGVAGLGAMVWRLKRAG
ncbi:MAG: DUF3999 family protein [Burkholderiales bacterium]